MGRSAMPTYLTSHLAPVPDEIDAVDLPIAGTLPPELSGRYIRNGPNPLPGEDRGHWFGGQGMLHGVRLDGGRAAWYRNRWIRTGMLEGRPPVHPDGSRDLTATSANTHVVGHGGRLLALAQTGLPYEITPDLDTLGPCDFGGRLTTAMTAHPKRDPVTGELHFYGGSARPPYVIYHRLDSAGRLVHSRAIDVPAGTMMHDFAITEHYVIWLDLPVTFRAGLLGRSFIPYAWDDDYGARLGVMRRDRPDDPVRWLDVEPCWVFHIGNAHEDGSGRVVLDAARYTDADFDAVWQAVGGSAFGPAGPAAAAATAGAARLHRWTLDPVAGTVTEGPLDDRAIEFPTLDDDRVGRPNRFLYAVADTTPESVLGATVVKYDTAGGPASSHHLGPDIVAGEAVFVPAAGERRREDDGWLLSIATRRDGSASQLLVIDASAVTSGPVATVDLPRGVPAGFHGTWIPDDDTSA